MPDPPSGSESAEEPPISGSNMAGAAGFFGATGAAASGLSCTAWATMMMSETSEFREGKALRPFPIPSRKTADK